MNANSKQVGGGHYKNKNIPDHWDIAYELGWCYFVSAATKYLWRLGRKGDEAKKIEDVEKAIHYLQKKVELLKLEINEKEVQPPPFHHVFTAGDPVAMVRYDTDEEFCDYNPDQDR